MIGIIDYKAGNIASVRNALNRLDAESFVSADPEKLAAAEGIIFPGVGHAESAMEALREVEMDRYLQQTGQPVLGICLGMQLLFEGTDESTTPCLGVIEGHLQKFDPSLSKVPHMGWNTLSVTGHHPLLQGLPEPSWFYFVHSYYAPVGEWTIGETSYQNRFSAVVARDNYMGVQFHPEKSGLSGRKVLTNFLNYVAKQEYPAGAPKL